MGLNSVALDLLLRIHPMSTSQAEDQAGSSSRQDLKNDMQELEAAGFLKPCKDTPDSWEFAQVPLLQLSVCMLQCSLTSLGLALQALCCFKLLPERQ